MLRQFSLVHCILLTQGTCLAFHGTTSTLGGDLRTSAAVNNGELRFRSLAMSKDDYDERDDVLVPQISTLTHRRRGFLGLLPSAAAAAIAIIPTRQGWAAAAAGPPPAEPIDFSPKFVQEYPDFTQSPEGWSYKDVKVGSGNSPGLGDRVVFDWSGYTIGYFGRPFEAKGGPKGGAFDKDLDYRRAILGEGTLVSGLEKAMSSMKPGGVRQVIIPFGPLSYPQAEDPEHAKVGPKPSTFSGQRALNFVLDNSRVDRTLLFNVKLVRVDKKDGRGGFIRGDR